MTFADTSYLFAGLISADAHHASAQALATKSAGRSVVTTNHVIGEMWTLLRRRSSYRNACRFLAGVENSRLEIVHVDADLEREALAWLCRHDEREYSFVDATSFAFMRRNGITDALAFDGDFAAAGFLELRP